MAAHHPVERVLSIRGMRSTGTEREKFQPSMISDYWKEKGRRAYAKRGCQPTRDNERRRQCRKASTAGREGAQSPVAPFAGWLASMADALAREQ
jgi:hypothetical protein